MGRGEGSLDHPPTLMFLALPSMPWAGSPQLCLRDHCSQLLPGKPSVVRGPGRSGEGLCAKTGFKGSFLVFRFGSMLRAQG